MPIHLPASCCSFWIWPRDRPATRMPCVPPGSGRATWQEDQEAPQHANSAPRHSASNRTSGHKALPSPLQHHRMDVLLLGQLAECQGSRHAGVARLQHGGAIRLQVPQGMPAASQGRAGLWWAVAAGAYVHFSARGAPALRGVGVHGQHADRLCNLPAGRKAGAAGLRLRTSAGQPVNAKLGDSRRGCSTRAPHCSCLSRPCSRRPHSAQLMIWKGWPSRQW